MLEKIIQEIQDEIINYRRIIHQNPELGYEEKETSRLVAQVLSELGLAVQTGIAGTGVVALLEGAKPGRTILLRADMDALPISEKTNLPFSSRIQGKMHACGHDIHTATLLGVAKVLVKCKAQLHGKVKFVFQPAEECSPHGGAKKMIEEGILEKPSVDMALALHVWPNLPTGKLGIRKGPVSARSDRFFIKVLGKKGHASAPHQGIDAIVGAGQVISAIQTIISRRIPPTDAAVITIGKINGGERYNVICDKVEMEGTIRILTPGYAELIPQFLEETGKNAANAVGADFEMEYVHGYPATINDPVLTEKVTKILAEGFGNEALVEIPLDGGGEDFSFISQHTPSVYIKIGCTKPGTEIIPLHNEKVIFDEECIPLGIKTLSLLAIKLLSQE